MLINPVVAAETTTRMVRDGLLDAGPHLENLRDRLEAAYSLRKQPMPQSDVLPLPSPMGSDGNSQDGA